MVTTGRDGGVRVSVGKGVMASEGQCCAEEEWRPRGLRCKGDPASAVLYELWTRHCTKVGGVERRNQDMSGNKNIESKEVRAKLGPRAGMGGRPGRKQEGGAQS